MADTFTAKLGLRQYDSALNYAVSKFSADNLLIDNAIGTVICTSTTRPSTGLFNGMMLWETDTRRYVQRSAGAWVPVPVRNIVADAAARTAITTPYDGMEIYRQDRDWVEIYDGAAWRVQGTAICTTVADRDAIITSPYNGQQAITTTTGTIWVRLAGVWTASANRLVAFSERITPSAGTTTATMGVRRLDGVALSAGIRYRIATSSLHPTSTVSTDNIRLELRYNTAGFATTSSTVLPGALGYELFGNTAKLETFYTPASAETMSLALTFARDTGSGTVSVFADGTQRRTQFWVEECPNIANSGTDM